VLPIARATIRCKFHVFNSHHARSQYAVRTMQDLALLTVMSTGNDYLPGLPLSVTHGPNATGTYLQMKRTAQWQHRTLIVQDRQRRLVGQRSPHAVQPH
jgi:hypothetical protein